MKLSRIIELSDSNLAEHLDDRILANLGKDVIQGYKDDVLSRREWEEKNADALKLALQYFEEKTFPWPGASSVKYPLVLVSCVHFNARAYPQLVPGHRVVDIRTSPEMPIEQTEIAKAITEEMNWQIMDGEWEEGHDLLLMMLPLIGTIFKKTYFDNDRGVNRSYPLHPSNFVVDYWAKSLDTCERKTHVQYFRDNEIRERVNFGEWREIEYGTERPEISATQEASDDAKGFDRSAESNSIQFLEQCCWVDLDDDGYKEPYIVTTDMCGNVARVVDNFEKITLTDRGTRLSIKPEEYSDDLSFMKVGKITETQYYTKYGFIRSPDGGFYDVGLGMLLSPINHSVDTLINQLQDAGTLSNAQGGLLSRNVRIRSGNINVLPGKFIRTDASSEELKNGIFPWPVKEPSQVLFQLLGLLLQAGQDIGTISDMMKGQTPGQNTPASTALSALEQGLQVFSAIYKRIYRSMTEEFRKWFNLNGLYGENPDLYGMDIRLLRPTADPATVSRQQRLLKAEALVNRTQMKPHLYGPEGELLAETAYLEALDIPNAKDMLANAQPPQDPAAQVEQAKLEFEKEKFQATMGLSQAKEQREQERTRSSIMKDMATVQTKIAKSELDQEKQSWQEYMDRLEYELQAFDKALDTQKVLNERVDRQQGNQGAS